MTRQGQHWLTSRKIVERIVIEGDLVLQTAAHLGSGREEGTASLSLLRDPYDGAALLPGSSIAGALRSYWRERKWGYGAQARDTDIFGARRGALGDMEGHQSLLIVDDAFSPRPSEDSPYPQPEVEIRDGVKIDGRRRTAEEEKLFDLEVLQAGTRFRLHFELLVPEGCGAELRRELALALQGLELGEIGLGARKRRGLGRCKVDEWQVRRYDLTQTDHLLAWLADGRAWSDVPPVMPAQGKTIAAKLGVDDGDLVDQRAYLKLKAKFRLTGSLLVRSGQGQADQGPDAVHVHRLERTGDGTEPRALPILPGTSLAGVLRARGLRIAKTLAPDPGRAQQMIDRLFGVGPEDGNGKQHLSSRLVVHEAKVKGVHSLVQTRIRVDRFTGGAMDNYLFNEAPVFAGEKGRVTLRLFLREPEDHEIGLLLLLLKDLWTGDLSVGGESGIGRGRLKGIRAKLWHRGGESTTRWKIRSEGNGLQVSAKPEPEDEWQSLEKFVTALREHLAGEVNHVPDSR